MQSFAVYKTKSKHLINDFIFTLLELHICKKEKILMCTKQLKAKKEVVEIMYNIKLQLLKQQKEIVRVTDDSL